MKMTLIALLVVVLTPTSITADDSLSASLSFKASFEKTFTAVAEGEGAPLQAEGLAYTYGKVGQGIKIKKGSMLSYSTHKNMSANIGTISFWIKPYWTANEETKEHRFVRMRAGMMIYWSGKTKKIYFATPHQGKGWWIYAPAIKVQDWQAGEWHHIAVTWGEKKTQLYLDGEFHGEALSPPVVFPLPFNPRVYIGSDCDGTHPAEATIDEFYIWKRILSPEEIKYLFLNPEAANNDLNKIINNSRVTSKDIDDKKKGLKISATITNLEWRQKIFDGGHLRPAVRDYLFLENNPIEVTTYIIGSEEKALTLVYQMVDYYGREVEKIEKKVTPPCEDFSRFMPKKRGVFKLIVSLRNDEGEIFDSKELIFGIVPTELIDLSPNPLSPFGTHITVNDLFCLISRKIGANWVRSHDFGFITQWQTVEPYEKGRFQWQDSRVSLLKQYGLNILGSLNRTPPWAGTAPPEVSKDNLGLQKRYPPRDWVDWADYVRQVVKHYKDNIKYWEVWNEPNNSDFWAGTVEQYYKLLKIAYCTAKEVDPDCKIVAPAVGGLEANSLNWMECLFKLGGLDYIDIVSYHGYLFRTEDIAKTRSEEIKKLKDLIKKYGGSKPLWDTEMAYWSKTWYTDITYDPHSQFRPPEKGIDPYQAVNCLIQHYVVSLANGVEKIFYYYGTVPPKKDAYFSNAMLEYTGAPKAIALAHATLSYILEGAKYITKVERQDKFYCYIFKKGEIPIAVFWTSNKEGGSIEICTDIKNISIIDVMCNEKSPVSYSGKAVLLPLKDEPIFVLGKGLTEIEMINAFKLGQIVLAEEKIEPKKETQVLLEDIQPFPQTKGIEEQKWFYVDISKQCNMGFADEKAGDGKGGWTDQGPYNDMRGIETGRRNLCGVPFQIIDPQDNQGLSCIVLYSGHTPFFPKQVSIDVKSRIKTFYFLHTSAWCAQTDEVASYVINYENGQRIVIPVVGGNNILDWWSGLKKANPIDTHEVKTVALKTTNLMQGIPFRWFCILKWDNPFPEKKIEGISFISKEKKSVPILLAITGVKY